MSEIWIHPEEQKRIAKMMLKYERVIWYNLMDWDVHNERKKHRDNRKLAWIVVGKTRKMAWIDKADMSVAYKMVGMYEKSWEKWSKFTFERWCTSFDT